MDKLRAMRTVVAIADAGSLLTAAARALGSSLPAVVRTLAGLEATGVRIGALEDSTLIARRWGRCGA